MLLLAAAVAPRLSAAPVPDFHRDIEPLFTVHCLDCHGPETAKNRFRIDSRAALLRGGDSGEPALVPGQPEASHLIQLVTGSPGEKRMPPKGDPLSAVQIDLLRRWIAAGAELPESLAGESRITTDHWSFQPIRSPLPPTATGLASEHPIDAFIGHRLRKAGLEFSPGADRVTLIRRLFLDLHGLPPTPQEVRDFVQDTHPDAWARLVDAALAHPRYGERWARHWLDVVRFAESNGFETNHERPTAWRYRDYVIDALNSDKPYDRFLFEQLAGDSVGVDAATGFIVGGPFDRVKGKDKELQLTQRMDELADMVNTTGTAMLGLTLGCARCHSHKFDPVTQRDFYSMQAVFAGVRHGERPMQTPQTAAHREQAARLARELADLKQQLAAFEPLAFPRSTLILNEETAPPAEGLAPHTRLLHPISGRPVNRAGTDPGHKGFAGSPDQVPNLSDGQYVHWKDHPHTDLVTWHPRLAGRHALWLSWGVYPSHDPAAVYAFDRDGDLATSEDRTELAVIDQRQFAHGQDPPPGKGGLWSGLRFAGIHEWQPESVVVLRAGPSGAPCTADALVFQATDSIPTRDLQPRLRAPVRAALNTERFAPVQARFLRFTIRATNNGNNPCLDELELYGPEDPDLNLALAAKGAQVTASGEYGPTDKHRLAHLNDGRIGNSHSWISEARNTGWVEVELPQNVTLDRVVWGRDREGRYTDRLPVDYRIETALQPGQWIRVASSQDRLPPDLAPSPTLTLPIAGLTADEIRDATRIADRVTELEKQRAALLEMPKVYAGSFEQPATTHRLYRGDPFAPREPVAPEALEVLQDRLGSLDLSLDAPEASRRLALARWMTDPDNPLPARVMVNRVWQFHFGRGLVGTPSDFGGMGMPPTHPDLLNWLSAEFIRDGWSLKGLHRLILTSRTYQQSNRPQAEGLARDAQTSLLWRFPPRRLTAEAIRDALLFVSGNLDTRMGGPGFLLFEPNANYSRNWVAKTEFQPGDYRRMVYALKLRMEQDAIFDAFDAPDGGQVCPQRARSTTPIQALNLYNSDFLLDQAEVFAERIRREAGPSVDARIAHAFQWTFNRDPDPTESRAARDLVDQHGLPSLARALFNSNEFLFLP